MRFAAIAFVAACSLDVDYTGTYFECGVGGTCPDGYVCKNEVCIPTEPAPKTCSSAVSAGGAHACEIRDSDGTVWCWGRNNLGQLGNGQTADSSDPVQVTGITNATQVVTGDQFSCALVGGGVECWGANDQGQLGDNSTTPARDPVQTMNISGVDKLTAGGQHTCALGGGKVSCWGANDAGQLGNNSTTASRVPAMVTLPMTATAISAAGDTSCAVGSGVMACWGSNANGQFMTGTSDANPQMAPIQATSVSDVGNVAVGSGHVCVLTNGGAVKCAGTNGAGQLGDGTGNSTATAVDVSLPAKVTQISAGFDHTCAVDELARAWCWGSASEGKLGIGPVQNVSTSSPILTLFEDVQSISAGSSHTCARSTSGAIACAGTNGQGQLGNGVRTTQPIPIAVATLTDIVSIAAGDRFTCAADSAGAVTCWGLGTSGQLGDGGFATRPRPGPAILTGAGELHAGGSYICSIGKDKTVSCWGAGGSGQLGVGTATRGVPLKIPGLTGVDSLAVGDNHTCAMVGTAISCWGDNAAGKLGDPAAPSGPTPVPLNNMLTNGPPKAVAAGGQTTCVIDQLSQVQCWGTDSQGALGRGMFLGSDPVPQPVHTDVGGNTSGILTGAEDIFTRGDATFARVGGTVFGWGFSCSVHLGTNNVQQCQEFGAVKADNIMTAETLAIGYGPSCVLRTDKTVACWGDGNVGQIGDGLYQSETPTAVPSLSGVLQVAAGSDHVCAIKGDRTVVCWGNDQFGQLGDGVIDEDGPEFVRLTCE